jgi:hypothetical protein
VKKLIKIRKIIKKLYTTRMDQHIKLNQLLMRRELELKAQMIQILSLMNAQKKKVVLVTQMMMMVIVVF